MDETVRIQLSGHSAAFETTRAARDQLLEYLADARSALAGEVDGDETVRELEGAIGEQLSLLAEDASSPIDVTQMAGVLAGTGPVAAQHRADAPLLGEPRGRFWCRIDNGKWFGGICLGLAARGQFRVDWVRTISFLLLLVSGGLLGLVYLALLLVLPRVESVQEYQRQIKSSRASA